MIYRVHFGGEYKDCGDLDWLIFRLEHLPRAVLAFATRIEVRRERSESSLYY